MNRISLSFLFLCLFTLSNYLRPGFWLGESYSNLPQFFAVFSVLFFVLFDLKNAKKKLFINWSVVLIVIVYLFSCYSTFIESVDKDRSETILSAYLTKGIILYIMIVYIVNTHEKFKIYLYVLTLGGFLLAYRYINYPIWHHGRAWLTGSALTSDPNGVTSLFLYTLPLSIALIYSTKLKTIKLVLLYVCLIMLLGVIEAQSRGGFLALTALCGLAIFLQKSLSKKLKTFFVVSVLLIIAMIRFAPPGYIYRMQEIFEPETGSTGSAQARLSAMNLAVEYIKKHPISEYGIGNHSYYLAERIGSETDDIFRGGTLVHSFILQFGADAGSVPMVLYIGFIISVFYYCRKTARMLNPANCQEMINFNNAMLLSFTAFVVSALTLPWAYSLFIFYVSGLCTSYHKIISTKEY